jgi:hypothetical protein
VGAAPGVTLAGKAGAALVIAGVFVALAADAFLMGLSTRIEVRNVGSVPLRDVVAVAGGNFPIGAIDPGHLACTDVEPQRDDAARVVATGPQGRRQVCGGGGYVTGGMGGRQAFLMDADGRCDARPYLDDARFRWPCALVETADRLGWRSAGTD